MNHFIKEWVIPFYHVKLDDWETKKTCLLDIFETYAKPNMIGGHQSTDYNNRNHYHHKVERVLYSDILKGVRSLDYYGTPKLENSWFQIYDNNQDHAPHNHGVGGISLVVFIEYGEGHLPTTFMSPFVSMKDGNYMDYVPEGVEEGSMIMFPSALMHYAPVNQTDSKRMILSSNLICQ